MDDWCSNHLCHVAAMMRRSSVVLSRCETQLIVHDQVHRPPDVEVWQVGQYEALHYNPLSCKRGISVDLKTEHVGGGDWSERVGSPVVRPLSPRQLPGPGFPQSDRIDGFQVGGVWKHADVDGRPVTNLHVH